MFMQALCGQQLLAHACVRPVWQHLWFFPHHSAPTFFPSLQYSRPLEEVPAPCLMQNTQHSLALTFNFCNRSLKREPCVFRIFFYIFMCVSVLPECSCTPCVCLVLEKVRRCPILELKLQRVRHHVVTGTKPQSPAGKPSPLICWVTSPPSEYHSEGTQNYSLPLWFLVLYLASIAHIGWSPCYSTFFKAN